MGGQKTMKKLGPEPLRELKSIEINNVVFGDLDIALSSLKKKSEIDKIDYKYKFNGILIYSFKSVDENYKEVYGKTRDEYYINYEKCR
jgi:hypothetical protein